MTAMRGIFYIAFMVTISGCGSLVYTYKFSMKESENQKKLLYKNDTLALSFNFYLEGLMIKVTNRSDKDIKIRWDELKMTENEINRKIEHVSFRSFSTGEISVFQPSSIIPPKSACTDVVVYAGNIYYESESGEKIIKVKDMYPRLGEKTTRDSIQKLRGQRITLLFPIEINNVSYSRVFNFLLVEIKKRREISVRDIFPVFVY